MNDFRMSETSTLSCSVMTMKEEMFAVRNNEFEVPGLDEVNVVHIVNCAEGKEEEESSEIETVESDISCGKCGEKFCLLSFADKEEGSALKLVKTADNLLGQVGLK